MAVAQANGAKGFLQKNRREKVGGTLFLEKGRKRADREAGE